MLSNIIYSKFRVTDNVSKILAVIYNAICDVEVNYCSLWYSRWPVCHYRYKSKSSSGRSIEDYLRIYF